MASPSDYIVGKKLQKQDAEAADVWWQCGRKTAYRTLTEAVKVAYQMAPRKQADFSMKVYVCPHSEGPVHFHLAQDKTRPTAKKGMKKTKETLVRRTEVDLLRKAQDAQMKRIAELQEQLKIAQKAAVPSCWFCKLRRYLSGGELQTVQGSVARG